MKEYKGFRIGTKVKKNPEWMWRRHKSNSRFHEMEGIVIGVSDFFISVRWSDGKVSIVSYPEESLIKIKYFSLDDGLFEI